MIKWWVTDTYRGWFCQLLLILHAAMREAVVAGSIYACILCLSMKVFSLSEMYTYTNKVSLSRAILVVTDRCHCLMIMDIVLLLTSDPPDLYNGQSITSSLFVEATPSIYQLIIPFITLFPPFCGHHSNTHARQSNINKRDVVAHRFTLTHLFLSILSPFGYRVPSKTQLT